jgi:hypothetical protein
VHGFFNFAWLGLLLQLGFCLIIMGCCLIGLIWALVWLCLGFDCGMWLGWRNISSTSCAWVGYYNNGFHFMIMGNGLI